MKLKLSQIVDNEVSLSKLGEVKFPATKVSFKIARIVDKLAPDLKNYHKQRQELLEKYGKKEEKEGKIFYSFEADKAETFTKEIEDLLSLEIDVDFEPINITEIGDMEIEPKLLIPWVFTS